MSWEDDEPFNVPGYAIDDDSRGAPKVEGAPEVCGEVIYQVKWAWRVERQ